MGGLNEGCISNNGHVIGVIHRRFKVDHLEDERIQQMIVTDGDDLTDRKEKIFSHSDCFIVLPGGVGTFEEFWYGISCKGLSMKDMAIKPIVIVNIDGFYNGFLEQMKRAKMEGILYHELDYYFHVVETVDDALEYCISEVFRMENLSSDDRMKLFSNERIENREVFQGQFQSIESNRNEFFLSLPSNLVGALFIFGMGVYLGTRIAGRYSR